jgi:hypothetical protein
MRRQLERREVSIVARTSDPDIFVIKREGAPTLEKRHRIPTSAFPAMRSRKWSNGLVSARYDDPVTELIAMSDRPEFNQELYPVCDCFYLDGDQERPIDTIAQLKAFRKHGYRETKKQTKARLIRERDQAVDLLECLGFVACEDCHQFIRDPADYHHPADMIQDLCRSHYAARLARGHRYSGEGSFIDGLRKAHAYVRCDGCDHYMPEDQTLELPAWIAKTPGLDFKLHYCKALHADSQKAKLKQELLAA